MSRRQVAVFADTCFALAPLAVVFSIWVFMGPSTPPGLGEAAETLRRSLEPPDVVLVVAVPPQDAKRALRGLPFLFPPPGATPPAGFERLWLLDGRRDRSEPALPGLSPRMRIFRFRGVTLTLHRAVRVATRYAPRRHAQDPA